MDVLAPFALPAVAGGVLWYWQRKTRQKRLDAWAHQEHMRALAVEETAARCQSQYPNLHTLTLHPQPQAPGARLLPAEAAEPPGLPMTALHAPSTRALLDQGLLAAGRPLPLWSAQGPILLTSGSLWTAGLAGRAGSGKTRTAALLIGYEVLHGASLLVIDPHRHKDDSLSRLIAPLGSILLLPPALTPAEVETVLSRADAELAARKAGQVQGRLLLVVDEYTSYQRDGGPLAAHMARTVEAYATEGRGYGAQGLIIGQNWKASRSGGTEVREVLTSAVVHRSWKRQAAYLCPDDDTAEAAESLVPGRAIFVPTDADPVEVAIPLTESADLARIAQMRQATRQATTGATTVIDLATWHAAPVATNTQATTPDVSQEAQRALRLFQEHKSMARVVEMMYGITSDKGRIYQTKLTEVSALVAEAINALTKGI